MPREILKFAVYSTKRRDPDEIHGKILRSPITAINLKQTNHNCGAKVLEKGTNPNNRGRWTKEQKAD